MMLVNLSVLSAKPTDISIYAQNVVPYLEELDTCILRSGSSLDSFIKDGIKATIPAGMSPDFGMKGHAKRLLWTQFGLPKLYKKLKANLIFSPLPETPLYTSCCNVAMVHDLIPLRYPDR
nr:hypothetical protein [[Leptolyngbya] sp. PCC 7376]